MADANKTQLAYGIEATWGTSVSTLTKLRFTGESLNFNIQNITSNEIRSDRQVTDLIQTGADCSGGVNFELSYQAFDDLMEGALCNNWVGIDGTEVSFATSSTRTITVVGTSKTLTATGFTFNVRPGQFIRLANAGTNTGTHLVTGFTGGVITLGNATLVDATYDDNPSITIDGAYLRNGDLEKSFTIERYVNRAVGDDYWFLFTGMMVNTMQLTASASAIVTGSFDFIGKEASIATGSVDASYTEAPAYDVMNAVANVADVMEAGTNLSTSGIYFQELAFTVNNNLRGRQAIGVLGNVSVGLGRCDVNGTVTAYFETKQLYDKYVNATETSLSFKVENNSHGYVFFFPRVKFSSDAINAEGINTDIMERLGFQAIRHATYDATLIISRF